jgi:hypothetical protein
MRGRATVLRIDSSKTAGNQTLTNDDLEIAAIITTHFDRNTDKKNDTR